MYSRGADVGKRRSEAFGDAGKAAGGRRGRGKKRRGSREPVDQSPGGWVGAASMKQDDPWSKHAPVVVVAAAAEAPVVSADSLGLPWFLPILPYHPYGCHMPCTITHT
eukprot:GHVU01192791.1.p2 GENE.GHVU01192791.1~~GHVU01192791.1.p2  ORF type:complete len:108 (-),score=7.26 GHVU01192791.1:33-356(-)